MWPVKPLWRRDRRGLQVRTRLPLSVWRWLDQRQIRVELAALDRKPEPSPASAAELVHVRNHRALWRIAIPGRADRFMSLEKGGMDDDRFVVMADARRFYRAWLASSLDAVHDRRDVTARVLRDMPADYKYRYAVQGFAAGRSSPVPLATVGASEPGKGPAMHFTNGVTRTFWLLANGAASFPVETFYREDAMRLHRLVGLGANPLSCADLFQANTWEFDDPSSPWHPANWGDGLTAAAD